MTSRTDEELLIIQANSFKNFHCKGLSYICLNRTVEQTDKVYIFEGDTDKMPEVVAPHNHRYDFCSFVLSGAIVDTKYAELEGYSHRIYNRFDWRTPLLGGNGFTFDREISLATVSKQYLCPTYGPYHTFVQEIHTIQIVHPETMLLLHQGRDKVKEDVPTQTYFSITDSYPNLNGLYEKFSMDELIKKLDLIERFYNPQIY